MRRKTGVELEAGKVYKNSSGMVFIVLSEPFQEFEHDDGKCVIGMIFSDDDDEIITNRCVNLDASLYTDEQEL